MASSALSAEPATTIDQTAFNLEAWARITSDPAYQSLAHRVESNRFGQALMSPPPAPEHGEEQIEIGFLLRKHCPKGHTISECPISTSDGVKAADVAWISRERRQESAGKPFLVKAPEICVEVLSPSNRPGEMEVKKALYFEAGADEVWFRELDGTMRFFLKAAPETAGQSSLCPEFPSKVVLG